jgi:hypothetical protein
VRTQVHTARLIHTADLGNETRHNSYRLLADTFEGDLTDADWDHTRSADARAGLPPPRADRTRRRGAATAAVQGKFSWVATG